MRHVKWRRKSITLLMSVSLLDVFLLHAEKNQREAGERFVSMWTRSWTYQEPICKLTSLLYLFFMYTVNKIQACISFFFYFVEGVKPQMKIASLIVSDKSKNLFLCLLVR